MIVVDLSASGPFWSRVRLHDADLSRRVLTVEAVFLDLYRRGVYVETLAQEITCLSQNPFALLRVPNADVAREYIALRCQTPSMGVMHIGNTLFCNGRL